MKNIFIIFFILIFSLAHINASAADCVNKSDNQNSPDGNNLQFFSIKGKLSQVTKGGFYFYNYYKDSDNGIYSVHTLGEVTIALHKSKPILIILYKGNDAQFVYNCSHVINIINE